MRVTRNTRTKKTRRRSRVTGGRLLTKHSDTERARRPIHQYETLLLLLLRLLQRLGLRVIPGRHRGASLLAVPPPPRLAEHRVKNHANTFTFPLYHQQHSSLSSHCACESCNSPNRSSTKGCTRWPAISRRRKPKSSSHSPFSSSSSKEKRPEGSQCIR